ncbi:MAG: DUF4340 domain-containing protein [Chthoniobacteraceae bacterium]
MKQYLTDPNYILCGVAALVLVAALWSAWRAKRFTQTFVMLLLVVGLGGYVWLFDSRIPTTQERAEKKDRVFAFDRDKISEIGIKTPESKIDLRKDGANWRVEAPVKDRADSGTMSGLLTSVELLRSESTIDNDGKGVTKDQLKEYGLAEPQTKLTLTVDGKQTHLLFGKDTAIESRVYVMLEGAKEVLVVANTLRTDISKKADDFRDRKLSELSVGQVTKAVLKTPAGEIEVVKADDHWSLVRPLKARGDDAKIGDTVSQSLTARIESFVADTSKLAEYGLEQPRGTITLFIEGQDQPQVLSLGGNPKDEKDKEKVYARLSSRDAVVLLPKTIESLLGVKPNDLRDKKLAQFNSDLVDRITIEPAGKPKLVLARNGPQGWVRKEEKDIEVNSSQITRLLDELGSATVSSFVADVATELPKYGLDAPAVKVTLSAFSSENTAETKAGEKPIVSVLVGKVQDNDAFVKIDEEPFVFAVSKGILDAIVADPLQLQPLDIFKNKPEDIASFEIVREGQPTLSFDRDKDANWKLAKGDDKPHTINVQSLVNTLSSLHAVRWIGASTPEHGFDKPVAVVTFKTAGNTSGKLTLGAESPEKMRFSSADGLMGTFLIPQPDFEAFTASLLDKPAPAATPAPGAPGAPPAPGKVEAVTPPVSAPPPSPTPAPAEAQKPKPTEAPAQPPQKP